MSPYVREADSRVQDEFIDHDLSSLRRSEMFIDRYLRSPQARFGGAE